MEQIIQQFAKIKTAYERKGMSGGLICKCGSYGGSCVLKLLKREWTNDDMGTLPNQTGIFFSIWIDEKPVKQNRVNYNIHALKIRQLRGYKITSIAFAKAFRERFAKISRQWPNVETDFGPQTLMQGWIPLQEKTVQQDLIDLMNRFEELSPVIDEIMSLKKVISAG